jgi:hypothetical protein
MKIAVAGLASGVLLWLLGLFCAGGGHGTYLPITVFGAPLSLLPGVWLVSPLILWPLFGVAVARRWRLALGVLVLSHVLGVVAGTIYGTPTESSQEQWSYLANAARQIGPIIAIAFILYAAAIGAVIFYLAVGVRAPSAASLNGRVDR